MEKLAVSALAEFRLVGQRPVLSLIYSEDTVPAGGTHTLYHGLHKSDKQIEAVYNGQIRSALSGPSD